jgi:nicotinamidase-related amidase
MTADGAETAVVDELTPHAEDVVVRKTRVGAFPTTDLLEQLRQRGVTTLVLAGFATSGVVLSTVRDAADRDFGLVVLSDACGDGDQQVHEVLVEKVFPRQADVLTVAEFQQALAG